MLGQSNSITTNSFIRINNEDITITNNGVYRASQDYTGLGTVTVNVGEINNEDITISPKTSKQTFTPDENHSGFGTIVVNPVTSDIDNEIQSYNIKSGSTILGVSGNVVELKPTILNVTPSTEPQTFIPQGAYNGFSTVNINPVDSTIDSEIISANIVKGHSILGVAGSAVIANLTSTNVEPQTYTQFISPQSPYLGFSSIEVKPVTYLIDEENIKPENIVENVNILGIQGEVIPLKDTSLNILPTKDPQLYRPSDPYNSYTLVNVEGDDNLIPNNIVKGVSIFGVEGTYDYIINNQDKDITSDGVYTADSEHTGLGTVNVTSGERVAAKIEAQLHELNSGKNEESMFESF